MAPVKRSSKTPLRTLSCIRAPFIDPLFLCRLLDSGLSAVIIDAFVALGGRLCLISLDALFEFRKINDSPVAALVPRTASVGFALIAYPAGVVEIHVHQARRRRYVPDGKPVFPQTFKRGSECFHVSDLTSHEELERVFGSRVITEVDQALVNDFRARFCGNIASQVNIKFPSNLQIISGPGVAHGIEQANSASTGDRYERISLGGISTLLRRLEVHSRQCAYDFQMTQLFGPDIHQHVFSLWIITIEALNRVLHRSRQFAVSAAELLQQHVAKARIRTSDVHRVHEFFYVMVHPCFSSSCWSFVSVEIVFWAKQRA